MCRKSVNMKKRNLSKHAPVLQAFRHMSPKQLKAVVKDAKPDFIRCVCEICMNLLKNNIPVSPCEKKKLKKHKRTIRALAKTGESVKKKKKVILQKGSFAFLPLLAPLVASVVGGLLGRK